MAKTTKKSSISSKSTLSKAKKPAAKNITAKKITAKKVAVKKTVVNKVAAKKAPARKSAAKAAPKKTADNLNLLKTAIGNIEKSSFQVFDAAKQQAQAYAKQTLSLVSRYNDELKKLMNQDKTVQQKVREAEAKLKTKANATNKAAIKKAQKVWADIKKQQQQAMQQLQHTETVQGMAKNLELKLNFLAKELSRVAKTWRPVETAKPKAAAKPAAKKTAAPTATAPKVAQPDSPAVKPAATVSKPTVVEKPVDSHATTTQPASNSSQLKSPFTTPITPQNIAQKPLTGSNQGHQDSASHKPFGGFKDDF